MENTLPDNLTEFEKALYNDWTKGGLQQPLTFNEYNNKTTVCLLKLANGFEVVGTSGCEDPSKFNQLLGRTYALKDALQKLGEFAAFHRAEMKRMELKVLKVDSQLSPFEIEELRRLLKEHPSTRRVVTYVDEPKIKNPYCESDARLGAHINTRK